MKAFVYNALGYAKDGAPESVSGLIVAKDEFDAKTYATATFIKDIGTPPISAKVEEIPLENIRELLATLEDEPSE